MNKFSCFDDNCRKLAEELRSEDPGHSPIELALAMAVSYLLLDSDTPSGVAQGGCMTLDEVKSKAKASGEHITFWPQTTIGRYRVDFLLSIQYERRAITFIVIECDGHEFHERTKLQAARDKKRDRTLQAMGFPVLRFTGSEIWNDPTGTALDLFEAAAMITARSKRA